MTGSTHGQSLQADMVRQWLAGQSAAQAIIAEERRRWLAHLRPDEALALYLSLSLLSIPGTTWPDREPSPMLMAMRQALARKAEGKPS